MDTQQRRTLQVWILCVACVVFGTKARITDADEYCLRDSFEAKCPKDEIVMMKTAEYGRMRIGKCVQKDMGNIGCKENVMDLLSKACSGRQECSYLVAKLESESKQPCGEMKSYLEATYECVPVLSAPTAQCSSAQPLLTHGDQGYISSYVARNTGCGNMDHPWIIEVFPGQKVNISMTSFHEGRATSKRKCKSLGYITEVGHRNNATICARHGGHEHVYTSNGRHLKIHINTRTQSDQDFILHYKLFGCADLKVTPFSWYKREGDHATVGCEGQDIRWELRCVGSQWNGVVGNCTENIGASRQLASDWTFGGMDFPTMTIATIAFGFVVLVLIATIVVVWRCKDARTQHPVPTVLVQQEPVSYRMKQPPLPPIPENTSHYKTLIQEPAPRGYPQHSQTMPRPPSTAGDDYNYDWRFGTAPWNKPNM